MIPRLVLAAVAILGPSAAVFGQSAGRVLIVPFENVKRDASIFWLGESSAILIADGLNALGVPAISREERREAFERLQIPHAAVLTDATLIRIGQLVGASEVIMGSLEMDGDVLIVRAKGIALQSGRINHDVVDRGPVPEMFATFERIAGRLAGKDPSGQDLEVRPPLAVFENYIKGLLAETPATAITYLNAALSQLSTFDRARLALWNVYAEQGNHARALDAVQSVAADSRWSRPAKFRAGLSYLSLRRYDDAFAAFKALADGMPTAAAFNNLGVVQLRRGSADHAAAASYFNKAAQTDPDDPDYFFNLGYSYWLARDPQAAIYWLREAVRRNAADGDAHFILGAALAVGGSAAEAARERDLARRLSSTYDQWERRPAADAVPKGLERIKPDIELPHAQKIEAALATNGQRDQRELAQFYLDRARRMFEAENDRDAMVELRRAVYLSPYEAGAHLLIGRIQLRSHRIREAIDAFKISLWSAETSSAHLALGEAYLEAKDIAAARTEAERAAALEPESTEAKDLLQRLAGR